ncbi:MAG: outer membrane protein assembly factor BamA, partial [Nitrospirae bacterium]|nr:outer membrane protein assembly factor BamA [Nitrospirota bacterium]
EKEFLYMFGLKTGGHLDSKAIAESIKSAFTKGIFNDIRVYTDGGNVSIEVVERTFVDSVKASGTEHFSGKKLREEFELKTGMVYSIESLNKSINAMKKYLAGKGFTKAAVTARAVDTKNPYRVNVELKVVEGPPLVIKKITVNGKNNTDTELIDISSGSIYDKEKVEAIITGAVKALKKEGYFNPQVGPFTYCEDTGTLDISMVRGKKLEVLFEGNEKFSQKELAGEMPFFEYGNITTGTIEEALMQIVAMYHKKGYAFVSVGYDKIETGELSKITFTIQEGLRYKVSEISLEGVSVDKKPIMDFLPLQKGEPFDPDTIEDTKDGLEEYYRNIGFPNAKVLFIANKTDDVEKTAHLRISISEGERLTIGSIAIEGSASTSSKKELKSIIGLKAGTPLNESELFDARQRVINFYSRNGFNDISAVIEKKVHQNTVDITFIVEEGQMYVFGDTIVTGNTKTKWEVFRRIFTHKRGAPFNPSAVYEEVRELYKTELFKDVSVSFTERAGHVKDVVFSVSEVDPKIVDFGAGYGEYEGLRGSLGASLANLMGMNRQLYFRSKFSALGQKYTLQYYEPWFITQNLPFRATIGYEERKEIDIDTRKLRYRVEKYTASVGVERNFTDKLKGQIYYEFSLDNTWDVRPDISLSRDDTGTLVISAIVPSLIYDGRNSLTNPTAGIIAGISVKMATALLLSQTDFLKLSGYVKYYRGLSENLVLAASFRTGIAQGWNQTVDLPIVERFFLGGSTTVRGYGQDDLGPKGVNGDPTGGNAFLMGNLELRANVIDNFSIVPFIDAGNVWNDLNRYSPDDLRYTTGLGVRYMTPVGPLRLDYGHLLTRAADERAGRFYFSIGQAF